MSGKSSSSKTPLRKLRPAAALQPRPAMVAKSGRKTRAKNACTACQQSKKKCDEETPKCSSCIDSDLECVYSIEETARHKRNVIRSKIKDYESDIDKYERILDHIKNSSISSLQRVLDVIRGQASLEDIVMFIRHDHSPFLPTGVISPEPATSDLSLLMNKQWGSTDPSGGIDLNVLDDRPILNLSAQPWTDVTNDDELVSHLMSLYMTWDHPVWHLFDFDIFIEAMKNGDTSYCSPLLVNATLAEACHYSNRISFRADPHNPNFLGHRFFQEAMRLWNEETNKVPTLLTVQSAFLIGVTLSADGMDRLGGMFLNNGIRLCKELFMQPQEPQPSDKGKEAVSLQTEEDKKFEFAKRITLWAAFNFQCTYDYIVRCPHTMPVPDLPLPYLESAVPHDYTISPDEIPPPHPVVHDPENGAFRDVKKATEWCPYPYVREPEPNLSRATFQAHCAFHIILYELSETQFESLNGEKTLSLVEKRKYYEAFDQWKASLPDELEEGRYLASSLTFMHAHFHIVVMDIHQNKIKDEKGEDPDELEAFKTDSEARYERSKAGLYELLERYNSRNSMYTMSQPLTYAMLIASQNAMGSLARVKGLETPTPVPEGQTPKTDEAGDMPIMPRGPYDEDHIVQTFENTLKWACHASNSFVTLKIFVRLMQLEVQRLKIELSESTKENLRRLFQWEKKDKGKWIEDLEKAQTNLTWRKKKKESNIVDMVKSLEELTVQEG
ncbi:hypothetical protein H072_211 [Dactylellina haptotyla CBS 200.50]|uniref:Zn(2)-C6 fungal-type domain-containing protein n=1 Tax=Dactylellina haptotyla (strain CBS 200.50) TaxID=1284197 RepID=S8CDJ8_DACHA|nr:hypothetical protein H072_211 [Dactylellina haptotyla CBS 200.50]